MLNKSATIVEGDKILATLVESDKKLATLVESDQKAPFSIATTPRCRGGHYFIPWIASHTLPYYRMISDKYL